MSSKTKEIEISNEQQTNRKTKRGKHHRKGKRQNTQKEEFDSRFAGLEKPIEKAPPVDMFGRPISADAFDKYESSSDDVFVIV